MADLLSYLFAEAKSIPEVFRERVFHRWRPPLRLGGTPVLPLEGTGEWLRRRILSLKEGGFPFLMARFAGSELGVLNGAEQMRLGLRKDFKESARWAISVRAGIRPTDRETLLGWASLYERTLRQADGVASYGVHMEDYFYRKLCQGKAVLTGEGTEPLQTFWSSALKGMRVMVVSPFAEEMKSQYGRKELLFPEGTEVLPEMELLFVKPPVTLGDVDPGRSYIEMARDSLQEFGRVDFDIALVSAGGYAPLYLLKAREMGKSAIHVGGALQTMFGILGKRWDGRPHVARFVNEHWIRPAEKPLGCEYIDGGAYW